MSNFAFLTKTLPALHEPATRAEIYIYNDARSSLFYARHALENLLDHIYSVAKLPKPYENGLAARIHTPELAAFTSRDFITKAEFIRKSGNQAVHTKTRLTSQDAARAVQALYHLLIWTSLHCSPAPQATPQNQPFNLNALKEAAEARRRAHHQQAEEKARTQAELIKLEEEFEAERTAKLAREEENQALKAELAALRAQIAQVQAEQKVADTHDYREAETRAYLIDALLKEAGWNLDAPSTKQIREYPVQGLPTPSGQGFVDYVLWSKDSKPLALIEAKRTGRSLNDGLTQAQNYADALEKESGVRPLIFVSNGYEHQLLDDHKSANYPARPVSGFYTEDELLLLHERRRARKPLAQYRVNENIAGRDYQIRAITSVGETFTRGKRSALLVMATGTGKTRTATALIQQLMQAGWAKRVLFLADRTALVKQANKVFVNLLPDVPVVNLLEEKETLGRIFTSTYPTMLNLINQLQEDGTRRFGTGFFDLIIVDEAHRSVYAKYGAIFDHFDALKVGLTATPKDDIAHNTYRLFEIENGVPTDVYTYDQAVADGYLVPARGVVGATKFLREGISYDQLSADEQEQWEAADWGDETPEEVDSAALNSYLFNQDTIDKVLQLLLEQGHKVEGGDKLGKTIIFAQNQRHADEILTRFNALYPDFGAGFAAVITHGVGADRAQQLIDNFSTTEKYPQVAISVDMLDTGIDVPDVVNLVFFKAVRSKTKYWQMIGRGTRLRDNLYGPGANKEDFLVFDWAGNIEFFNQNLPEANTSAPKSLTERIFTAQLDLLKYLDDAANPAIFSAPADNGENQQDFRADIAHQLHKFALSLDENNVQVKAKLRYVHQFKEADNWQKIDEETYLAAEKLGALHTEIFGSDIEAKRFDLLLHRAQLAVLIDQTQVLEKIGQNVRELAARLHQQIGKIPAVTKEADLISDLLDNTWWQNITPAMLEVARKRLRNLISLVQVKNSRNPVVLDIEDTLENIELVDIIPATTGTDIELFEKKARAYLREHLDNPSLKKVYTNEPLVEADYAELEGILISAGIAQPEVITDASQKHGGLGLLIRSLVGLDEATANSLFAHWLHSNTASVDQINFVKMLVQELTERGTVAPARLFEAPYTTSFGQPFKVFGMDGTASLRDVLLSVEKNAKA